MGLQIILTVSTSLLLSILLHQGLRPTPEGDHLLPYLRDQAKLGLPFSSLKLLHFVNTKVFCQPKNKIDIFTN